MIVGLVHHKSIDGPRSLNDCQGQGHKDTRTVDTHHDSYPLNGHSAAKQNIAKGTSFVAQDTLDVLPTQTLYLFTVFALHEVQ